MLSTLRRYLASCRLDQDLPSGGDGGEFGRLHRLLSEPGSAPRHAPSPALRSAIMCRLHESAAAPAKPGLAWRWPAAAAVCLLLGIAAVPMIRPAPAPGPGPAPAFAIPMDPSPVFRLVAGSVDQPLLDQAQKMYSDTRRATRAVANCVPFARGG